LPRLPDIALRPQNVIFSLNSFAAAALALFISFSADLPRPYWSTLTVYITVQPLSGALRSKAVFRVLGTLLGAAAAVVLIPNLVNEPELLSVALAGWVGFCLYISLLDRTPRSYVFLLAGYTAAFVGFPTVDAPQSIFDTAVARAEEVTIGILCATLFHSVLFPRQVTAAVNARIAVFLSDARAFACDLLSGLHGPQDEQKRQRIASGPTELQILATHLAYDTSSFLPRTDALGALEDRFALLLPHIVGVADRVAALRSLGFLPSGLSMVLRDVTAYLQRAAPTRAEAESLEAQSLACVPAIDFARPETVWPSLLATNAALRLSDLVQTWQDGIELADLVRDPHTPPPDIAPLIRKRSRRPLDRDPGLAALSAAAAMIAVLACCTLWIGTAWPDGSSAPLFAAVAASFFATLDDPAPVITIFLGATVIGMIITAFYQFAVLPAIDGFPMLLLVLSPFYLVLGYLQADPAKTVFALPLILGFTATLALQETYSADFANFLNINAALIVGLVLTLWTTQIFRSIGAVWGALRIFKRSWRDLADLAAGRRWDDYETWTSLMLDRLALIAPRLALAGSSKELEGLDALADLRAGLNIITLRDATGGHRLPELRRLFALISQAYERRSAQHKDVFGPQLLQALDSTIEALGRIPRDETDIRVPAALTGLRRALYPRERGFAA
jgi:uncharacterized membrane protein YccC